MKNFSQNKLFYALFHILGEIKLVQNSVDNRKSDGSSLEKNNSWMSLQSCLFNNKHLLHWRGGVLPYRVPPGGSPRNIPSQMWGHRGPLSRELNPGAAGPGIGASPINLKQNMKPRHFSFVGHCRGQGEYTTLGQTLIYFSKFFTKFRRNSGKPLLSCPQVNSVNCSNECYVRGPQHVILPYFNHFSDVHGLCQFRRDSV